MQTGVKGEGRENENKIQMFKIKDMIHLKSMMKTGFLCIMLRKTLHGKHMTAV